MGFATKAALGATRLRPGSAMGKALAGTAFRPSALPGCEVWFDARQPNGFAVAAPADGAALAEWKDLSGNARHAAQGSGSLQPLYKLSGRNLLPSVVFDGSDDRLTATISAFSVATMTAYVVLEADAFTIEHRRMWQISGGAAALQYLTLTTGVHWFVAGSSAASSTAPTIGAPAVISGVAYTTDSQSFSNGTGGTIATTDPAGTSGTSLDVGSGPGTNKFAGGIAALLIYSVAHDTATRKTVERWLGRQFGITVA